MDSTTVAADSSPYRGGAASSTSLVTAIRGFIVQLMALPWHEGDQREEKGGWAREQEGGAVGRVSDTTPRGGEALLVLPGRGGGGSWSGGGGRAGLRSRSHAIRCR